MELETSIETPLLPQKGEEAFMELETSAQNELGLYEGMVLYG